MKRRSFLQLLLGAPAAAAVPKVEAAPKVEVLPAAPDVVRYGLSTMASLSTLTTFNEVSYSNDEPEDTNDDYAYYDDERDWRDV